MHQAYILSSLLKDLENDSNVLVEERNDEYILTSSVNYPNNSSLISQKITFGKDYLPKQVEVFNKEGITNIKFIISKIDLKPKLVKEDFDKAKFTQDYGPETEMYQKYITKKPVKGNVKYKILG